MSDDEFCCSSNYGNHTVYMANTPPLTPPPPQTHRQTPKTYTVNGESFNDSLPEEGKCYTEFEVHVSERDTSTEDGAVGGPISDSDDSAFLDINSLYKAANGYIINNTIFLTNDQWETIVYIDENLSKCALCNIVYDKCIIDTHLKSYGHLIMMDMHQPLQKYDLSITRKIRKSYHCGVCNQLFDDTDSHFVSKLHEGNLLFCINKASDIIYDDDIEKKGEKISCYHFNSKKLYNNNNNNEDFVIYNTGTDVNDNEYYNDDDGQIYDANGHFDDNIDYEVDDIDDNMNLEFSYASIARKPKAVAENYVEITKNGATIKVKFDSYHMVFRCKINEYYCMLCKENGHWRNKTKHCEDEKHLEYLNKCLSVDAFKDYFIRQVDDKLYHCGHCNNLQLIHDMTDHIETKHSNFKTTDEQLSDKIDDDHKKLNVEIVKNDDSVKGSASPIRNVTDNQAIGFSEIYKKFLFTRNMFNGLPPKINEKIIIWPFGQRVCVTLMAYKMIMINPDSTYYCMLCNFVYFEHNVMFHINEPLHVRLMEMVPFIFPFGNHLIRMVRNCYHCCICNVRINVETLHAHIVNEPHAAQLRHALGAQQAQNIATVKKVEPKVVEEIDIANDENEIENYENEIENDENEIENDEDDMNATFDTTISDEVKFDTEEKVILKLKNFTVQLSNLSYNTFVAQGDGCWSCFVCGVVEWKHSLLKHAESRSHLDNLNKLRFLEKCEDHWFRQLYMSYHCALCNVTLTRKHFDVHLKWPTHLKNKESGKVMIKHKTGQIKEITVFTQKEALYLHEKDSCFDIIFNVILVNTKTNVHEKDTKIDNVHKKDTKVNTFANVHKADTKVNTSVKGVKLNKIVICCDKVLKIKYINWHGISTVSNKQRCIVCQIDVTETDTVAHCDSRAHLEGLQKPFDTKYADGLIRVVSDLLLNCVICNAEVSKNDHIVKQHLKGKRHVKNYDVILKDSSEVNSYLDCYQDVLTL